MRIGDVLKAKPRGDVVTIEPEATVRELVALLTQHNVGAVVVSTDGASIEGIASERDVVRRLHDDPGVLDKTVGSLMTDVVETCDPGTSVDELMRVMTERRVRHVPVVVEGRLQGIISIGDVVKHRIGELQFERDQLEGYVRRS